MFTLLQRLLMGHSVGLLRNRTETWAGYGAT